MQERRTTAASGEAGQVPRQGLRDHYVDEEEVVYLGCCSSRYRTAKQKSPYANPGAKPTPEHQMHGAESQA